MTEQQIKQANQMHESGITWNIIAAYFKTNEKTLLHYRKHYGTIKKE